MLEHLSYVCKILMNYFRKDILIGDVSASDIEDKYKLVTKVVTIIEECARFDLNWHYK